MIRPLILTTLLASGCAQGTGAPAWAVAQIHLQPGGAAAVEGWVNWQLYDATWEKRDAERAYLCSALATVVGPAESTCTDCELSWDVQLRPDTSDCGGEVWSDHPLLTSITGIGIGALAAEAQAPEEATLGSWIRYEDAEWLPHGWATSQEVHVESWPSGQSIDLHAGFTWPLDDAAP